MNQSGLLPRKKSKKFHHSMLLVTCAIIIIILLIIRMDLQKMHDRVAAYLAGAGFKDWSVCKPFDSKASTSDVPVMECRVTLNEKDDDCQKVRVIVLRGSWILRGGMEWGSREVQALLRVCDATGTEFSNANIPDESAIDAFLEKHLISGEALTAYKQELIQDQQKEARLKDAVLHCVREQDINEMVRIVMGAGVARLGRQEALDSRSCFSQRVETLVRQAFRDFR